MYKETFPFVDGWVVPPFYQRTVSFAFHSFNLDEKRGGCISWRSEAFAFGIVKSPCYEFTHSDFTIPTATAEPDVRVVASGSSGVIPFGDVDHCKSLQEHIDQVP